VLEKRNALKAQIHGKQMNLSQMFARLALFACAQRACICR